MNINLKDKPFNLSDDDIEWVLSTFKKMTLAQKCGQVFCPMGLNKDEDTLRHLTKDIGIGGLMYRADYADNILKTHKRLQELSNIPLLLAANTESGGDGLAFEGTSLGKPMAIAATNDSNYAYKMGEVACKEGAALGLNWSFAPIVDINYEFHNPITNVRTFGSDPKKVLEYALEYKKAADENDVAIAAKHFPGDGVDERDQHILTSVNSFSCDKWDETYGYIYKNLIDAGTKTIMVGHIALPSYVKAINPNASKEETLYPSSISKEILTGLLRHKLGFNGLVCSDATPMVGFTSAVSRSKAIPMMIENGCDMILFNKSLEEDYKYLLDGIDKGTLSLERLDEAVIRILATKASLHLHTKKANGTLVPDDLVSVVGCEKHKQYAKDIADKAITLVRDDNNLLPLSTSKYKRVYLNVISKDFDPNSAYVQKWKKAFEDEGFEVSVRDRRVSISVQDFYDIEAMSEDKKKLMHEMYRSVEEMKKDYDLYVYICNMENASNNTTLRLNWNVCFGLGDDAPWFASEIPTMMISTAYPYHLFDAPMIKTYINTYSGNDEFIKVTTEKIMGRSKFKGVSPIDPLCGKDYI